MSMTFWTDLL